MSMLEVVWLPDLVTVTGIAVAAFSPRGTKVAFTVSPSIKRQLLYSLPHAMVSPMVTSRFVPSLPVMSRSME